MNKDSTGHIDLPLLITVVILVAFGLVMVFSASSVAASQKYGDAFFFLKRQVMWLVIGFIALIIAQRIEYTFWHKVSFLMVIASFLMLVLVLIPGIGVTVAGARRWFRLSFIGFQPSEFAKLSLIIYTASWIDRKQSKIQKDIFLVYLPKLVMIGMILLLILKEPDLGTTVLLSSTLICMHFVGGLRLKYLIALFLTALPALYYAIFSSGYRRRRIFAFLNPWEHAQSSGYQIIQSLLAVGSGGITGVGIGASKLKLLYLPEAHTDFIYPIIAEELGIIGALGVIGLFAYFCYRGIKISIYSRDYFGKLLAFGLTMLIVFQSIINIGVTIGMLPTKGMPLPFISFGGSSLVILLFSVGIILNISKHSNMVE
jgi:cell division protein FtsW